MSEVREESTETKEPISDEEVLAAIRRFWTKLTAGAEGWTKTPWPTHDPLLRDRFSETEIEDKMEQMADDGILEYGISVRSAWIVGEEAEGGLKANTMRILSKVLGDKNPEDR